MTLSSLLLCALFLASHSYGIPAAFEKRDSSDILCTCDEIAAAISGDSQVSFPRESFSHFMIIILIMGYQASSEYLLDISHPAPSASEASICSVEPGSAEDVSKIVRHSNLTKRHFPTRTFIDTYLGIKPNSLCCEGRRTRREPRIFRDAGRTDIDDTLQRDKG